MNSNIDLGRIIRLLLMQTKLIAAICLIGLAVSLYSYFSATREYRVNSLMQIYSDEYQFPTSSLNINPFLGSSNTTNVENIATLFTSRTLLKKLIIQEGLNITFSDIKNNYLRSNIDVIESSNQKSLIFNMDFGPDSFSIENEDFSFLNLNYNELHYLSELNIQVSKPKTNRNQVIKTSLKYVPAELLFKNLKGKLSIQQTVNERNIYRSSNSLINISLITEDIDEGINILNAANNLFIQTNISTETENAKRALDFLDSRIEEIQYDLEIDKQNFQKFREKNQTVDVDLEIQKIINSLTIIDEKINQIDLEINKALESYTTSNPLYLELASQRDTLILQRSAIESEINDLPLAQQEYIDRFKELELKQNLYSQLLSKKLELSIQKASTLGNMRIVDSAYFDQKVSPQLTSSFTLFFIMAFASILLAVYRGLFLIPVTNPAEFKDSDINNQLLAVIPKLDSEDNSESFNQSIENLFLNISTNLKLKNISNASKTVLLTSPTSENGKSFITRSLSKAIAKLGKKVVLIDVDWKRGDQHKDLNRKKITIKEFENISKDNIDKYKISENFYLIPKITQLDSSFQYIYSSRFVEKLNFFKSEFEYLVLDTAPILSVSDTSVLMTYSDINILLTRHGQTKINEARQCIALSSQVGIDFDGIIYNSYEKPSSYYGYYGLYGNYEYQYYANKYLY